MANYFEELNSVNLSGKIEKKNGLSYVSWSYAWQEIKKRYPEATYTIYENNDGLFYHTDGNTCWVKTGVTVCDIEHIEYLPVMDFRNKSIPLANVTSMDVNKAIQRSLTKACARHGLGLYVYAGEDLPEQSSEDNVEPIKQEEKKEVDKKSLISLIENAKTYDEAKMVYEMHKQEIMADKVLFELCTNRSQELRRGVA